MNAGVMEVLEKLQKMGKLPAPRRVGKNVIYDCPFHSAGKRQDTASFGVHATTGAWNCYNPDCHSRGPEIYSLYAALTGIKIRAAKAILPRVDQPVVNEIRQKLTAGVSDVPEPLAPLPHTVFIYDNPEATDYMASRRIPHRVWNDLGLMYAPDARIPSAYLAETGGRVPTVTGRRIVFPMRLPGGKTGYMGRSIDANAKVAKFRPISNLANYFYDPLGILDNPGEHKRVFLVEGEFSLAACVREGLPAVCTLGSSLGAGRLKALYGFDSIVVFYDGDQAGQAGAADILASARRLDPTFARRIEVVKTSFNQDPANLPTGFGKMFFKTTEVRTASLVDRFRRRLHGA